MGAGFGFVIANNKMEFYAVEKNVSSGMERQREDYKITCSIRVLRMVECFFPDDDGCFCVCVERSGTGSR